eukprot:403364718
MKEFLEKALGGGRSDDLPFVNHYYLEDDTCEIREVHHPNDGRDSFTLLLKRQKLSKSFAVNQPGQNFIGDNYLTSDEIDPKGTIDAFGCQFRITGVDQFAQEFYLKKYNKFFDLGKIEFPKPREPKPIQIPPQTGFRDETDSLGYVSKLLPNQPKRDIFKQFDNDKKVLRFTTRLNTRIPEDLNRRFIISFFLSDDTISIFEPAQKNSDIIEGIFLERRKYKNIDKNNEFLTPTDLAIGGDAKKNGLNFHLLSADDYTQNYLNQYTY